MYADNITATVLLPNNHEQSEWTSGELSVLAVRESAHFAGHQLSSRPVIGLTEVSQDLTRVRQPTAACHRFLCAALFPPSVLGGTSAMKADLKW